MLRGRPPLTLLIVTILLSGFGQPSESSQPPINGSLTASLVAGRIRAGILAFKKLPLLAVKIRRTQSPPGRNAFPTEQWLASRGRFALLTPRHVLISPDDTTMIVEWTREAWNPDLNIAFKAGQVTRPRLWGNNITILSADIRHTRRSPVQWRAYGILTPQADPRGISYTLGPVSRDRRPLDAILTDPTTQIKRLEYRQTEGGRVFIEMVLQKPEPTRVEVWLDPHHGWILRRFRLWKLSDTARLVMQGETSPEIFKVAGTYFPKWLLIRTGTGTRQRITLTVVPPRIREEIYQPSFPPGTVVTEWQGGQLIKHYRVPGKKRLSGAAG